MNYSICKQVNGLRTTNITKEYYCAMREDNKKVYRISRDCQGEHLLFDFGLQVGDSVCCMGGDTYDNGFIAESVVDESLEEIVRVLKLEEIDTCTNTDDSRLRLKRYHFTMKIRERMADGSVNEYEGKPATWLEGVGARDGYPLNSWCVPTDILSSNAIYDLPGRKLQQIPKKGIYIQNGRKYVVR